MAGQPTARDNEWVRSAVVRFEGPLTLYAAKLVGDADRARDVVQDVFLKLCGQDRDAIAAHLAEWLFTVCRNRALDVLRKEGRMTRLSDEHVRSRPGADPAPPDVLDRREQAARVLRWLEDLPPSQREVLRLKFQNGFSYKEISRISGYSVGNVGFLIHVGLKALRGRMALADGDRPASARS